MTAREIATVLAALRYWQWKTDLQDRVSKIETNDGQFHALDDVEIDALCERINLGEAGTL